MRQENKLIKCLLMPMYTETKYCLTVCQKWRECEIGINVRSNEQILQGGKVIGRKVA